MDSTPIKSGILPRLSSCCCGCSLKTGTIMIAVYYLISCMVGLPVNGMMLATIGHDEIRERFAHNLDIDESKYTVVRALLGTIMVILVFGFFINFLLIAAAVRGIEKLILIWLVAQTALLSIGSILLIANGIFGYNSTESRGGSIAGGIINILLGLYFLLVVYSFYRELKENITRATTQTGVVYNPQGYVMPVPSAPYQYYNQPPMYPSQPSSYLPVNQVPPPPPFGENKF